MKLSKLVTVVLAAFGLAAIGLLVMAVGQIDRDLQQTTWWIGVIMLTPAILICLAGFIASLARAMVPPNNRGDG